MARDLPFWMVFGVGQREPRCQHPTEHSALTEAKRLARENPGVEFVVLASIHSVVKQDVEVTRLLHADDMMPF